MNLRRALLLLSLLGLGIAAVPEPPKLNPNAEADGQALVAELLAQTPDRNFTNHGVLRVRGSKGPWRENPLSFRLFAADAEWTSVYETAGTNGAARLTITRQTNGAVVYRFAQATNAASLCDAGRVLAGAEIMTPFAGSDFWVADLGLEFLRWPVQKLLRKELKRGQSCNVLESRAPASQTNGYTRVLAWLDIDTGGVVMAEAYDATGNALKEFLPKGVEKVNGRYELEEMQIANLQTGSRTVIRFKFDDE